ncbi:hypothetical protein HPB52_008306 [Rhipicephalus sanguineus]|uniref:Uncharacterized protein n=1 Tax=Rhipicephalus sanguineus TaxID=34632 RepID=A0A9D4Q7X9_RHISA|nr:hypothetical protein HPB52_008306 [Rhipicephalus sanguineus]
MQNRFATTDGDAFRLFIHYRLKGGQTIKDYYDEKKRLGSLADLKECHIISGLTDGVPPDVELALAGLSFKSSSDPLPSKDNANAMRILCQSYDSDAGDSVSSTVRELHLWYRKLQRLEKRPMGPLEALESCPTC